MRDSRIFASFVESLGILNDSATKYLRVLMKKWKDNLVHGSKLLVAGRRKTHG